MFNNGVRRVVADFERGGDVDELLAATRRRPAGIAGTPGVEPHRARTDAVRVRLLHKRSGADLPRGHRSGTAAMRPDLAGVSNRAG